MLQIFHDIWRSKISRTVLLVLVVTVVFALVWTMQFKFNVLVTRLMVGMQFDDPSTYEDQDYGYSEDSEKATEYFHRAVLEILEEIEEPYLFEIPDDLFEKEKNQMALDEAAKTYGILYNQFFRDLTLFCTSGFMEENSLTNKMRRETLLSQRTEVYDKKKHTKNYALSTSNYGDYMNLLIRVNDRVLYYALQKKPDYAEAMELQKKLLKAVCRPDLYHVTLIRAIEYIEYKTEKEEYGKLMKLQIRDPEVLAKNKYQSLKANPLYRKLLWEHFAIIYGTTGNTLWMFEKSKKLYSINRDPKYLQKHIESLLKISGISGVNVNRSIYNYLRKFEAGEIEKIDRKIVYQYALAATAFRASLNEKHKEEEFSKLAKKHLKTLLREYDNLSTDEYYRQAERLYFLNSLYEN